MKGFIGFENHNIHCIIGIHPEERKEPQDIYVDLRVYTDLAVCTASDCIENAIDYTLLAQLCTELAVNNSYQLLETFAAEALDEILKRFVVEMAWIKIKKPHAIASADYAFVEMTKTRD